MHVESLPTPLRTTALVEGLLERCVSFIGPIRTSITSQVAIDCSSRPDNTRLSSLAIEASQGGAQILLVVGRHQEPELRPPIPIMILEEPCRIDDIKRALSRVADDLGAERYSEESVHQSMTEIIDDVAKQLGGHIIVEDAEFQMLAYSKLFAPVDHARHTAVLQRGMPENLRGIFNRQGIQARLHRGEEVVTASGQPDVGLGPRLVVAVRHHERLLGSLWFARENPPFNRTDERALKAAARQISAVLAALLDSQQHARVVREDAVRDLIHGHRTEAALKTLGHDEHGAGLKAHVLVIGVMQGSQNDQASRSDGLRKLFEHFSRSNSHEVAASLEDDCVVLVHFACSEAPESCEAERLHGWVTEQIHELASIVGPVACGIGSHATGAPHLEGSAALAQKILELLQLRGTANISTAQHSWAPLFVHSLAQHSLPLDLPLPTGLDTLLTADHPKSLETLETVQAALAAWGNPSAIAGALHIHPNTVRYRLQRFQEDTGINLHDVEERTALWLLLTMRTYRGSVTESMTARP